MTARTAMRGLALAFAATWATTACTPGTAATHRPTTAGQHTRPAPSREAAPRPLDRNEVSGADPTFDIAADPDFGSYRSTLATFASGHAHDASSDLCVLGLLHRGDGSKSAWVWWPQAQKMVLWEAGDADLDHSRREINLTTDVVAIDAQLAGSTYLVTRAWVDDLVARCDRVGTKIRVERGSKRE